MNTISPKAAVGFFRYFVIRKMESIAVQVIYKACSGIDQAQQYTSKAK